MSSNAILPLSLSDFQSLTFSKVHTMPHVVKGILTNNPKNGIILNYGELSSNTVDHVVSYMNLNENDIYYELGCGRGRCCFQFFFCTIIKKVVGVEIESRRINMAVNSLEDFKKNKRGGLIKYFSSNREIIFLNENILNIDFSSATILYTCSWSKEWQEGLLNEYTTKILNKSKSIRYVIALHHMKNLKNMHVIRKIKVQSDVYWGELAEFLYLHEKSERHPILNFIDSYKIVEIDINLFFESYNRNLNQYKSSTSSAMIGNQSILTKIFSILKKESDELCILIDKIDNVLNCMQENDIKITTKEIVRKKQRIFNCITFLLNAEFNIIEIEEIKHVLLKSIEIIRIKLDIDKLEKIENSKSFKVKSFQSYELKKNERLKSIDKLITTEVNHSKMKNHIKKITFVNSYTSQTQNLSDFKLRNQNNSFGHFKLNFQSDKNQDKTNKNIIYLVSESDTEESPDESEDSSKNNSESSPSDKNLSSIKNNINEIHKKDRKDIIESQSQIQNNQINNENQILIYNKHNDSNEASDSNDSYESNELDGYESEEIVLKTKIDTKEIENSSPRKHDLDKSYLSLPPHLRVHYEAQNKSSPQKKEIVHESDSESLFDSDSSHFESRISMQHNFLNNIDRESKLQNSKKLQSSSQKRKLDSISYHEREKKRLKNETTQTESSMYNNSSMVEMSINTDIEGSIIHISVKEEFEKREKKLLEEIASLKQDALNANKQWQFAREANDTLRNKIDLIEAKYNESQRNNSDLIYQKRVIEGILLKERNLIDEEVAKKIAIEKLNWEQWAFENFRKEKFKIEEDQRIHYMLEKNKFEKELQNQYMHQKEIAQRQLIAEFMQEKRQMEAMYQAQIHELQSKLIEKNILP